MKKNIKKHIKKHITYTTPTRKQRSLYLLVDMGVSLVLAIPFSFLLNNLIIYLMNTNLPNGYTMENMFIEFPIIITFIQGMAFIFSFFIILGFLSLFVGYTLGSILYHIKLIDSDYNEIANTKLRFKRSIITILDMCFLLGLGSFSSIFDKEGRTMADRFAKTKIAYEKIEYKKY